MPVPAAADLDERFPRYSRDDPAVPTWCLTPDDTGFIHRFFNTSPISPSGRYVALTQFPQEDRLPDPGDRAAVVLVDLLTGERETVAETAGWDTQMGTHLQWGSDDSELFFNDVDTDTWRPYGVTFDPQTDTRHELDGTVYHVAPDGERVASPNLLGTRVTQDGYGVVVPEDRLPHHDEPPTDDGLFVTDVDTGEKTLLVSIAEIVETLDLEGRDVYGPGSYYGFHVQWDSTGERLLFVLRYWPDEGDYWRWHPNLLTVRADGSDLSLALPSTDWDRGGHHVAWIPGASRISMNLQLRGDDRLSFVSMRPDGSDLEPIVDGIEGSGHPALHPDGRYLVTDAYPFEDVAYDDGSVPLRLVDCRRSQERRLLRLPTEPAFSGPYDELRVDPHPAWGPDGRFVVCNAFLDGGRRVLLCDCSGALDV
jgi:Tol biopolymer transport system component